MGSIDILLQGTVGSQAYGLATELSDRDVLGVFRAPTKSVLGLHPRKLTENTITFQDPDTALHELGKFATLALRANPTVLELLYLEQYDVITPEGLRLVTARDSFLSTNAVRQAFGGYTSAQARRVTARSIDHRTAKAARHCGRLLTQGITLLNTGSLPIDLSEHREILFGFGELAVSDPYAWQERFAAWLDEFDNTPSSLPDAPDEDSIEDLVQSIRLEGLS